MMLKKLLIALCLCTAAQLPADIGKDGAPAMKDNILWQPIRYTDPERDVRAQFPGKTTHRSSAAGMTIESELGEGLYRVDIYNRDIPKDPKIILAMVNAQPGVTGKIVKKGLPKNCSYLIAFERSEKGKVRAVGRVYISKNAAYNFLIQGDLSLADKVFASIEIRK